MKIFLIVSALVASAAAAPSDITAQEDTPTTSQNNHPITFIGKENGDLERCTQEHPNNCEIFHQANSPIYSLLISGEHIYAGLDSGVILKCNLYKKDSCETYYSGDKQVWSLLNAKGHLYAGLVDGTILRCELDQPSCKPLHNLTYSVNTLHHIDDSIFAGLASGDVIVCSLIANNCRGSYEAEDGVSGIASIGDNAYVLTNEGQLLKCTNIEGPGTKCVTIDSKIKTGSLWEMKAFNESLYVYGGEIGVCKWVNEDTCETFIDTDGAWSLAIAYGTHDLQDQFKNEHECKQQSDACQRVTYYNEQERAAFEVYVNNGKIRNSLTYSLVNTENDDDEGNSHAAVFVMAPDGKLYVSKHQGGVHTSSFLSGAPVSGAGEIEIEYGVIKKIVACSHHYKPDLELNKQVIESLRTQGYTKPIVSEKCK